MTFAVVLTDWLGPPLLNKASNMRIGLTDFGRFYAHMPGMLQKKENLNSATFSKY
jgi:hypothetical protein